MNELELQRQLQLLQRQAEAVASLLEDTKLNVVSRIATVELELEVVRRFLQRTPQTASSD